MTEDRVYREAVASTLKFESEPSALEELHREFPGLTVTSTWHGGNSGPGVTTYVATWRGHAVTAFNVNGLRGELRVLAVTDPRD